MANKYTSAISGSYAHNHPPRKPPFNKGIARSKLERKREEAQARQEAYNKLSIDEKVKALDERLGKGVGATKQRARLKKMKNQPVFTPNPKAVKETEKDKRKKQSKKAKKARDQRHEQNVMLSKK